MLRIFSGPTEAVLTTYKQGEALDHKSLKFIWKVEKDEANPGYFFFKNMQTGRYIGETPVQGPGETVQMSDSPNASYNIVANRNQAGFFTFYSPKLGEVRVLTGVVTTPQIVGNSVACTPVVTTIVL